MKLKLALLLSPTHSAQWMYKINVVRSPLFGYVVSFSPLSRITVKEEQGELDVSYKVEVSAALPGSTGEEPIFSDPHRSMPFPSLHEVEKFLQEVGIPLDDEWKVA